MIRSDPGVIFEKIFQMRLFLRLMVALEVAPFHGFRNRI